MSGKTHFIGIGGTGLSAIARVLLERGEAVSGSDRAMSEQALALQKDGAQVFVGHKAEQVNGAERVIRSSAVQDDNVEVQRALEKGIPVLKRSDALGSILEGKRLIAVAGSHGKTTTSAMVAWMLSAMGEQPGYIVGSALPNTGTNASAGKSDLFVIEADEYDYMFLGLSPNLALVTNVEHDHPDMFPSRESFFDAFHQFLDRVVDGGAVLYCADDVGAAEIAGYAKMRGKQIYSYALADARAQFRATNVKSIEGGGTHFRFEGPEVQVDEVKLPVPGKHNVQNATGALAAVALLGFSVEAAVDALSDFAGTGRRFEEVGVTGGITFVDDYGHHPSEIAATLEAANSRYPNQRLIAVWQPHTYSRTLLLWGSFMDSLLGAAQVFVLPVFAAREQQPEQFDLERMLADASQLKAHYCADFDQALSALEAELKSGDIVLVLSAGDATAINQQLVQRIGDRT